MNEMSYLFQNGTQFLTVATPRGVEFHQCVFVVVQDNFGKVFGNSCLQSAGIVRKRLWFHVSFEFAFFDILKEFLQVLNSTTEYI